MIKIDDDGQVQIDGKAVGWLAREHVDVAAVRAEIDRLTAERDDARGKELTLYKLGLQASGEIDRLTERAATLEKLLREHEARAQEPALTLRERVAVAVSECPECGAEDVPSEGEDALLNVADVAASHGVTGGGLRESEESALRLAYQRAGKDYPLTERLQTTEKAAHEWRERAEGMWSKEHVERAFETWLASGGADRAGPWAGLRERIEAEEAGA